MENENLSKPELIKWIDSNNNLVSRAIHLCELYKIYSDSTNSIDEFHESILTQITKDSIKSLGIKSIGDLKSLFLKHLKEAKITDELSKNKKWFYFENRFYIEQIIEILKRNKIQIKFQSHSNDEIIWNVGCCIKSQNESLHILDCNFLQLLFLRQLIISDKKICGKLSEIIGFEINKDDIDKSLYRNIRTSEIKSNIMELVHDEVAVDKFMKYMNQQNFMNIRKSIVNIIAVIMLMRYDESNIYDSKYEYYWKSGCEIVPILQISKIYQDLFIINYSKGRDDITMDKFIHNIIMMTITSCVIRSDISEALMPIIHIPWLPHLLSRNDIQNTEIGNCNMYSYLISLMLNSTVEFNEKYTWIIYLLKSGRKMNNFSIFIRYIGVFIYGFLRFCNDDQALNYDGKEDSEGIQISVSINDSWMVRGALPKRFIHELMPQNVLYHWFIQSFHMVYGDVPFGKCKNKCVPITCISFKHRDTNQQKICIYGEKILNEYVTMPYRFGGHSVVLINTNLSLSLNENEIIDNLPFGKDYYNFHTILSILACARLYKEFYEKQKRGVEIKLNHDLIDDDRIYLKNIKRYNKHMKSAIMPLTEDERNEKMNEKMNIALDCLKNNKIHNLEQELSEEIDDDLKEKIKKYSHEHDYAELMEEIKNSLVGYYFPSIEDFINIYMDLNRNFMYYLITYEQLSTLWLVHDVNYPFNAGIITDLFCNRPITGIQLDLEHQSTLYSLRFASFYKASFLDHNMKPIDYNAKLKVENENKFEGAGKSYKNRYLKLVLSWILIILLIIIIVSLIVIPNVKHRINVLNLKTNIH